MRLNVKLPIATLLFMLAGAAWAAPKGAGEPPLPPDNDPTYCDQHANECEQMRSRHEAFCKRNPHTCAAGEKRREARRAYCKQHPDECQAVREERKERRDAVKERCEKNPKACEERKESRAKRREEMKERCKDKPDECKQRGHDLGEHEGTENKPEGEEPERSGPPR